MTPFLVHASRSKQDNYSKLKSLSVRQMILLHRGSLPVTFSLETPQVSDHQGPQQRNHGFMNGRPSNQTWIKSSLTTALDHRAMKSSNELSVTTSQPLNLSL
jgi:hypothetical protein